MTTEVKMNRAKRRKLVSDLHYKGNTKEDIASKLKLPNEIVGMDLKFIKQRDKPKGVQTIEMRKNRSLHTLRLIQKRANDIADDESNPKSTRLGALRITISAEELVTKVEGIVTEKAPEGKDKRSRELMERLIKKEKEAEEKKDSGGNGQGDVKELIKEE